jgi:undecaprenyl-diphosphatase
MSALQALVLGIVQGLSEFLPISSSGHLILVPWLLGWQNADSLTFDVGLHLGTAVAVLLYFWRTWIDRVAGVLRGLANPTERKAPRWRLAWMIVLGSIPAGVIGAALESSVEAQLRQQVWLIGVLLLVFGLLLGLADRVGPKQRSIEQLSLGQALIIGTAQALALVPGVSRSGITLTAALFLGLNRESATRFAFLLSMPVTLGAVLFEFAKLIRSGGFEGQGLAFALGILAAFVTGMAAIGFLLRYVQHNSLVPFVAYRVVVGVLVLLLFLARR